MSDHEQEQEMELEALEAILMGDFVELESGQGGLGSGARCFQVTISPVGDDEEEAADIPVRLALVFAHTPQYPDEPPLFDVRSLQGIKTSDLRDLKDLLADQVAANLGMAMIYTLVTAAKEWLRENYGQEVDLEDGLDEEQPKGKDEIIEPHGEVVTVQTFLAWRERFEAEQALERAKLLPESILVASKEKKISGRSWFEIKGGKPVADASDEDEEETAEFEDFDDEDLDEDDMLDHYLSGKSERVS
eukprot:TRINITY_DN9689_c0_g1_i1.p1 TRINITY_DN9689_c0_g1~~TRINITY_DN9689_c0_g1_i1.p1  ORF type:complete len:247 (-),score=72.40 TRINITY_DN9689_c0_g1_i1:317-1057(-)